MKKKAQEEDFPLPHSLSLALSHTNPMPVDPAAKLRELFATFLQLDTTQLFLHDELTQVCCFIINLNLMFHSNDAASSIQPLLLSSLAQ